MIENKYDTSYVNTFYRTEKFIDLEWIITLENKYDITLQLIFHYDIKAYCICLW